MKFLENSKYNFITIIYEDLLIGGCFNNAWINFLIFLSADLDWTNSKKMPTSNYIKRGSENSS